MRLPFHKAVTILILPLCLSGYYSKTESRFFPYKLPDTVINEPYSVTLYNFAGYIDKNDIQVQIIPKNNSFKIMMFYESNSAEIIKFIYIPKKVSQHNVSVTGIRQQRPFPSQFFKHNYSINVLGQSSVCNYQGIIYNSPRKTKEFINLPVFPDQSNCK